MKMRVSAVQYHLHSIASFAEFAARCEHYVRLAQEFATEFLLFPEFFTTQLLSIPSPGSSSTATRPASTITRLPEFTEQYRDLFRMLSRNYRMHIVAGTHVIERVGKLQNTAHLFYPDGRVAEQAKLHITPTEAAEWNIAPGAGVDTFDTPKGRIAMLTCYDIEFPEIVRIVRAKGADIVFCPSCTDDLHGFHRVRYCCHARAVENQVYIVTTGTVGSLPTVDFMRMNTGQAAIIAPNDVPFPPRGIVAEGQLNNDMIVTADLDLALLEEVRAKGSVTTWRDRRTDLYTDWK